MPPNRSVDSDTLRQGAGHLHVSPRIQSMLSFRVHGENAAASPYLWELTIQARIAQHSFESLRGQAEALKRRGRGDTRVRSKPIGELFADCSAFLSASGVISKILFAERGASQKQLEKKPRLLRAARRSAALRDLLDLPDLPALRSLDVRNTFEHIDERLDRLMQENRSGDFVWLHTTRENPPDALVLKRFDPNTLIISYLDQSLSLPECMAEIQVVRERLPRGYGSVRKHSALLASADVPRCDG